MLTIGRTVSGENTMRVSNNVVSGTHCKIFLDKASNIMYIEDLGSMNGTFVNGVQVVRYALKVDDKILLGGNGGYATTLREILKYVEEQKGATQKVDINNPQKQKSQDEHIYAEEFAQLKSIYENYHKETLEIKDKIGSLILWRLLPSGAVTVLSAVILYLVGAKEEIKGLVPIGTGIIGILSIIISSKIVSKKSHKYNAMLLERQEEFQLSYVCPKCRSDFGNRSWAALHNRGCCPTCKAKFK